MAKTSNKSTQATVSQRVTEIVELLLEGRTRTFILQYAIKSNWGVSDAQVDKYIGQANEQIKEINNSTIEQSLALITTNQMDLYRKALKEGNHTLASKILMDLAKLKGLDKVTIDLKVEKRDLEDTSDADLLALLQDPDNDESK